MIDMDAGSVALYVVAALIALVLQFIVVRWAVLSALKAHSQYEREFARKVAAERAR